MRNKLFTIMATGLILFGCIGAAGATSLFVDSAPNVYGSPDYAPWWAAAKTEASAGTFVNMGNSHDSSNIGTTNFEIEDLVVYSFGNLGSRLHFIYWLPGESIASLTSKGFQVALDYVWDGVTYDFYTDYYGQRWLTPSKWEEYNGGVIGSAGFAWWGAYGVNTQAALDAELAEWDKYQGDIIFHVKLNGVEESLTAHHAPVPEPATMLLMGTGVVGLVGARRKKKA